MEELGRVDGFCLGVRYKDLVVSASGGAVFVFCLRRFNYREVDVVKGVRGGANSGKIFFDF